MQGNDGEALSVAELGRAVSEARGLSSGFASDLAEAARQMRAMDVESRRLSRSIGSSLRSAFEGAVIDGKKFGHVLRGLAADLMGSTFSSALRPVQTALGAGVQGAIGSMIGEVGSLVAFEKGGAFSAGRVRAFARGGVVEGATSFPMRGGTGVMGEAGPEAIMPLTRGPDGSLGVRAEGGAGKGHVTINIHTPDVEGFRRSRGQVAAQIARAVARGERTL